jgi:hypothetical protein
MRWKIIAVNAFIILLVGVGLFGLLLNSLSTLVTDPAARRQEVSRSLRAANARLALDAAQLEKWLDASVNNERVRAVFSAGTEVARQEAATAQANQILEAAVAERRFEKMTPSLVLLADDHGVVLGRNGSALMRGQRLVDAYPRLQEVLKGGPTSSDAWVNRERNEQLLASYAGIYSDEGKLIGVAVVATPLNDERLARTSELASGQVLAAAIPRENALELIANSSPAAQVVMASASSPAVLQAATLASQTGAITLAEGEVGGNVYGAAPIQGYGSSSVVLIGAVPASLVANFAGVLGGPIVGMSLLGLLLVVAGGTLLGNYISRPISELEDGLLAVMNGNQDLRFQIEHAELGGLVFRVNSLLNTLMGVPEDTSDEEGRPSQAPSSKAFTEALSVDESFVTEQHASPAEVAALQSEPESQYYGRLHREFVQAKRQLGDPVEQITFDAFLSKLRVSEQQLAQKHGKPVRFRVTQKGNAVVLVAIPLPG